MRLLSFLSLILLSPALPGIAPAYAETAVSAKANVRAVALDQLFIELRKAKSEVLAKDVAERIQQEWVQSGSATTDLLMQWSGEAMNRKDYAAALDFLDQAVTLKPDFAEGWNRRATVHYLMNNYSKSMADIEKTLALEPRHFGALAGMGAIFLDIGKKELALEAYKRALSVYPMMRDLQKQVGDLEEQIAGSKT